MPPAGRCVALLAEGVDRNLTATSLITKASRSPSSRRAWIEMPRSSHRRSFRYVALLAEGVDRNFLHRCIPVKIGRSPSSRRAWIEIPGLTSWTEHLPSPSSRRAWIEMVQIRAALTQQDVALLAEGVDRNTLLPDYDTTYGGRPPRGGRG